MKKAIRIVISSIFLILIAGYFILKPYYLFLTETLQISPIKALAGDANLQLINRSIYILILGIPGDSYEGPYLSDAINVIHYDLDANKITVIGIPRDIWSDTLQDKINSAYAYGEAKQKGGGLKLAKAEVAGIIGQPVPYGVVINFDDFEELIDFLDGIEVDIERSFTDHEFPVAGREADECGGDPLFKCRYQTVTFQKGLQQMDGKTALTFVRSRHASGIEGSDFARNHRQQVVMNAVKNKIIEQIKSLNINTITALYNESNKLLERDISNQALAVLAINALKNNTLQQKNVPLSLDLFEVPDANNYYGKYVLVPIDNNPQLIQQYINCVIKTEDITKCGKT